jgi:hypothetical protein
MYLGAPFSDASSIKSKSKTKFKLAIKITIREKIILNIEPLAGLSKVKSIPKKTANEGD